MKHLAIVCISLFVSPLSLAQTLNCTTNVIGNTTYKTCYDSYGKSYSSTTQSIGNQQYTNGYYSSGNSLNRTQMSTGTPPVNFGILNTVNNPAQMAMQGYEQAKQRRQAQESQEHAFGIQERQLKLQERELRLYEQQLKMAQQQRELDAIEQGNAAAIVAFQKELAEKMKDEGFRRELEKAMKASQEN